MGSDRIACEAAVLYFGTNKIFSRAVFRVQSRSCSAVPQSTCCGCKWPFPFIYYYISLSKPVYLVRSAKDTLKLLLLLVLNTLCVSGLWLFLLVETYSHCVFRSLQMLQSHAPFHLLPQYSLLPQGSPRSWLDTLGLWLSTIHKP